MNNPALGITLLKLKEGDVMEAEILLPGLSDEKVAWQVLESVPDPKDESLQRLTLHAFYYETFVMAATVRVDNKGAADWSFG